MPNYRGRTPGTRRIVVWVAGKSHERIVPGTKAEGDAYEARLRLELEGSRLSTRTAPSFERFCVDVYAPHARAHLKESTWSKVRRYQIETLCSVLGKHKLTELTTERVEAYKLARVTRVRPSSVNNELRVLRTVLGYAKTLGYPCAVATWKKLPVRGQSRARVWSTEQVHALFDAARSTAPELLPALVFLLNTGCRKGEAIACEWSWIEWDRERVAIPSNEFWQPKNGLPREIPISNALRATLSGPRRHERWCFPNRDRGRYAEFPKDIFSRVRAAAGLVGGPHTLRHTFASHFLASCPDMFLLAQVMGHSHQRVTELYSHLLPEHLSRARNAVDLAPRTMALAMAGGTKDPA